MSKGYSTCLRCFRSTYNDESILLTGIAICPFCNMIYNVNTLKDNIRNSWDTGPPPAKGQFQRYPSRFWYNFKRIYGIPDELLHMFSGAMDWGDTTDIRPETGAKFVAPYNKLPIKDNTYDLVIADPPYNVGFANEWITHKKDLPKPKHILIEAARVTKPGGLIAILHVITIPQHKAAFAKLGRIGVERIALHSILCGPNNAVRQLNVLRKNEDVQE